MTNAELEAEHVKALAAACFQQMTIASAAHTYVAQIHAKWGNHPAFKQYLKDMALDLWMERFIAGGPFAAKIRETEAAWLYRWYDDHDQKDL